MRESIRMPLVRKKNGTAERFDERKIINAIQKSAGRVNRSLTDSEVNTILYRIYAKLTDCAEVTVPTMHDVVENALRVCVSGLEVYEEYRSYRNYKERFNKTFEKVLNSSKSILVEGSRENANKDSQLISTKKELISGILSKELYLEYELPPELALAHKDGGLYIHDTSDRSLGSINCCLFDVGNVLKDGFSLNGVTYTEPTSAESALRVISDIILQASSQQYGGFTIPELDNVLAPYVEKALVLSKEYYRKELPEVVSHGFIETLAYKYVERALEQGFQAMETRLNTINNANGQTAFITVSFGLNTTDAGRLVNKVLIENRMNGIGSNHITPVFPKLVFLPRDGVNCKEGDPNYDLYLLCIKCSLKRIYPDYLSLNSGYLGEMYDKYGLAVSPMG